MIGAAAIYLATIAGALLLVRREQTRDRAHSAFLEAVGVLRRQLERDGRTKAVELRPASAGLDAPATVFLAADQMPDGMRAGVRLLRRSRGAR